MSRLKIEDSWKEILLSELNSTYMQNLSKFLREQITLGKTIYPPGNQIFNAFNKTPFPKVKVVILGQDPYHGESQAHGLSFSVKESIKKPPSLQNIFKELQDDINIKIPSNGNLENWANQGVLLLNASLSVEISNPGSHSNIGWEDFIYDVIKSLNKKGGIVFMLWGNNAKKYVKRIDQINNLVLTSSHPSPLSAHKGFFGCKHFSKCNTYLIKNKHAPIKW